MRVTAYLSALVLFCVLAVSGCQSQGPLGPEDGPGGLTASGDKCDPIIIPC